MTERRLGPAMRWLVGVSGAGVLALGVFLAAINVQRAAHGASAMLALPTAAACVFVAVGGASLLRSALRGRIALRRIRRRPRGE